MKAKEWIDMYLERRQSYIEAGMSYPIAAELAYADMQLETI